MPLVRFTAKAPVGRRVEQHLRRLRLDLPRGLEVDRAEIVLSIVSAGLGFAILTPTLLLDDWQAELGVTIKPLPTASLTRTLSLVARERELGNIPSSLAVEIREALAYAVATAPRRPPAEIRSRPSVRRRRLLIFDWLEPMHPIIALWSHPRSMSTATERLMRERGDLTCFHEPYMYYYYVERAVRVMPLFDVDPEKPKTYEAIRDMLLEAGEAGPVFFKDMSYYVLPRLLEDRAFAERLTHTFLIRDPVKAILSYYKLDPDLTLEEIGLEAIWTHIQGVREN